METCFGSSGRKIIFNLEFYTYPNYQSRMKKIIKKFSGQEKLLKNCQLLYVPLYNIYLKCYLPKRRNKIRKRIHGLQLRRAMTVNARRAAVRQVWGDGACGAGGAGAGNSKEDALARRSIELIGILEILKELGNMITKGNTPTKCNLKL